MTPAAHAAQLAAVKQALLLGVPVKRVVKGA